MKYLLAIVALLIGFLMVKKQLGAAQKKRELAKREDLPQVPKPDSAAAKHMVGCAHCGVYFEHVGALTRGTKNYCSAEHMEADAGGPA